jgi:hypothetical protein
MGAAESAVVAVSDDLADLLGAALQRRRWRTIGAIVRFAYAEGSSGAIDLSSGQVTWTYGGNEPTVRRTGRRGSRVNLPGAMLLDRIAILAALAKLDDVTRAIVWATEVRGESTRAIAKVLTLNGHRASHMTVQRKLHAARATLAHRFEELGYLDT